MLRSEFASQAAGNGERLAARIATEFLLGQGIALSSVAGGDLIRGLLLIAILDANVRHLRHAAAGSGALAGLDTVPADELRAPISISALARSLSIPYETARRHVGKLMEMGACARIPDEGVIVPAAWVASHKEVTESLYFSLQGLLGALHGAGFDLEAMALNAPSASNCD